MAVKKINGIAGATKAARALVELNPHDIVIDDALRARHFPPTEEQVTALAISMYDHGQLEPMTVRPTADGKAHSVFGVTRVLAARMIVDGFTAVTPSPKAKMETETRVIQNADFKVRAEIVDINEEEAFIAAVKENSERVNPSPVDSAFNHERMRKEYGYKDAEIARQLNVSKSEVSRLKSLLTLDEPILKSVHTGELSLYSALELCKLPDDARPAVIAATGGKLEGIREAVRATQDTAPETQPETQPQEEDAIAPADSGTGEGENVEEGKETATQMRTIKQVIGVMSAVIADSDMNPVISTVTAALLSYARGEKGWNEKKVLGELRNLSGK